MTPDPPTPDNNSQNLQEFFDDSSFKTLYGGVLVTWVATSAIADVWSSIDPKTLGFAMALIVAFVGYFVSEQRNLKKTGDHSIQRFTDISYHHGWNLFPARPSNG